MLGTNFYFFEELVDPLLIEGGILMFLGCVIPEEGPDLEEDR